MIKKLLRAAFPETKPEVDLHGMRVPEALACVEETLKILEKQGGGEVRIICGKGKGSPGGVGVLRQAVCGWLDARGIAYRRVVDGDGGDGSVVVQR